jgi:hypothetical protein
MLESTKSTACSIVSQNRVIRSSVIGIDPNLALSKKNGITLPRDPRTFPYRTAENLVSCDPARTLPAIINLSEQSLVAP